jgi:hypothetical protein
MHPDIKANFSEKLELTVADLIQQLSENFIAMVNMHASQQRLSSGDTIKKTMELISKVNSKLFQVAMEHVSSLNLDYSDQLESEVESLVTKAQENLKAEALALAFYKKSTEHAKSPQLYALLLPDLEATMYSDLAKFKNSLNSNILQFKLNIQTPTKIKALYFLEALLLLLSMFVAGMWFKDPSGNYEPIIVILALIIPLIAVFIKMGSKRVT